MDGRTLLACACAAVMASPPARRSATRAKTNSNSQSASRICSPTRRRSLGWVSIDTNIATRPPVGYCWFDPWWGLRCDSVQPTHTTTEVGTAIGVGVRWSFSRRVFLDASVGREWIDFDNADRPDFTQLRIAFGSNQDDRGRGY